MFEQLRWSGQPSRCPHCATAGRCYFLRPRAGEARTTRTGARSARRVWKCGACRRQFSVLTATIFERTRIALTDWLTVVAEVAATGSLPSTGWIIERTAVSAATAGHMTALLTGALAQIRSRADRD